MVSSRLECTRRQHAWTLRRCIRGDGEQCRQREGAAAGNDAFGNATQYKSEFE